MIKTLLTKEQMEKLQEVLRFAKEVEQKLKQMIEKSTAVSEGLQHWDEVQPSTTDKQFQQVDKEKTVL